MDFFIRGTIYSKILYLSTLCIKQVPILESYKVNDSTYF